MHSTLATASLTALLLGSSGAAAQTSTVTDRIDRFVRAELARQGIPGMAVAVLRGDSVLPAKGYGLADVERRIPATDSTLFPVGSLSKQFTAAAVVLLVQQGRLRLDDPITRYLPEGGSEADGKEADKGVWSGVTIRHLLTHTSGIPEDTTIDFAREYSESDLVRSAAARPLEFRPGTLESYCSSCYALLGTIIHRASGVPWGDFVRDQIFRPLEMRTAGVNTELDSRSQRAIGYYRDGGKLQPPDPVSRSINARADCCLSFSARDLSRWAVGLNRAGVLGRAGLEQIWTPVRLNNGGTYPYGLGWNLVEQRGYRRIGHSGAWQGCHATLQRYPDFNLTVIVLLNLGQANSEGIATAIAGLLEPKLASPQLLSRPLSGPMPPVSLDRLLQAVASGKEGALVTPEFTETFPAARRELIGSILQGVKSWTMLGCDDVRGRGIRRLRSPIEHICYAKGTSKEGASALFTVPYAAGWRAAGLDNVFGI